MTYSHELIDTIFLYISEKVNTNSELSEKLNFTFSEINNSFVKFGTEYKRMKYLEQKKLLIKPNHFTFGTASSLTQINIPSLLKFLSNQLKVKEYQ